MKNTSYKIAALMAMLAVFAVPSVSSAQVAIQGFTTGNQNVNLTTDAPTGYTVLNWATWYTAGTTTATNTMVGGTVSLTASQVGTATGTSTPPSVQSYSGNGLTFNWTDGNPNLSLTENSGIYQDAHYGDPTTGAAGDGFSITTGPLTLGVIYELHLFTGVYDGTNTVTATLDGSEFSDFNNSLTNTQGGTSAEYVIDFSPTVANQTLTVSTIETAQLNGNTPLDAISLSAQTSTLGVVPEPSTYALLGLGAVLLGFQARRKGLIHS